MEFDQHAADYEKKIPRLSGSNGFAIQKVAKMAELRADNDQIETILDFGCGIGLCSELLLETYKSANVICADTSSLSLERLRQRISNQRLTTHHIESDALEVSSNSVDIALAACVLHHIARQDRQLWVDQVVEALKPGGELFIFEHNPWNPVTQLIVKTSPLDRGVRLLRPREVTRLLSSPSLKVDKVSYQLILPPNSFLSQFTDRLLHRLPLGTQFVVRAQKT